MLEGADRSEVKEGEESCPWEMCLAQLLQDNQSRAGQLWARWCCHIRGEKLWGRFIFPAAEPRFTCRSPPPLSPLISPLSSQQPAELKNGLLVTLCMKSTQKILLHWTPFLIPPVKVVSRSSLLLFSSLLDSFTS